MKTVCFNSVEKSLRAEAAKVLDSPLATSKERYRAEKLLRETLESARQRYWKIQARRRVGPRPGPQDFTTEAEFRLALEIYRDGLDKLAAEEVLDTPGVALAKRTTARKILEALEKKELLRGARPVPRVAKAPDAKAAQPASRAPRSVAEEGITPDVQKFFEGLAEKGEPDAAARQDETHAASAPGPAPQAPPLYCESHACPIEICGCNETCPLCLQPRKICGHRKGEK